MTGNVGLGFLAIDTILTEFNFELVLKNFRNHVKR